VLFLKRKLDLNYLLILIDQFLFGFVTLTGCFT